MTSENKKHDGGCELINACRSMAAAGERVAALKRFQASTGCSILEARDAIFPQESDSGRLAIEASEVHRECGLSPRELLDKNQDYKAQNARLTVALRNLCKHFPTDADMAELGWEVEYVETACQAYDTARAVLAKQKE